MIVAINYANAAYKKQQRLNAKTAYLFGKVDKVYSFSPDDIDKNFYEQNKNILSCKRGAGLWLWKPYFILKVLDEIQKGDYLLYVDSGAFYIRKVHSLVKKLEDSKQEILITETPLLECQWTKKEILTQMDAYTDKVRLTNQIMSGFILIKKSDYSVNFIRKWFDLCKNETLAMPKIKNEYEDFMYIANRDDQSLLSVLAKKEGIVPFSDPSDYGKFPNQYLSKGRLFLINRKEKDYRIEKPFFLLSRKANPVLYIVVYFIKSILGSIGLRKVII
jgi:hypothetical protein